MQSTNRRRALTYGIAGFLFLALPGLSGPAADTLTPDAVMKRAQERFDSLTDYECLIDIDAQAGARHEKGTYHFWFRKPAMLRVKVLKGGNGGSEVAVSANGRIRGRKGGLLKPFVMRLDADDKRLRSLRGIPLTELDWGSFYRKWRERNALAGARSTLVAATGAAPHEVVLEYTADGKRMREIYRIDPMRWIMIEGDVFEDGKRVDHVAFRDVRLDTGVAEKWFNL